MKIGITGGIGAGKSTISKIFEVLGIPVYNADKRAKWLQNHDDKIIEGIKSLFGIEAYHQGELQRQHIAQIVFSNQEKLDDLNAIIHPAVGKDYSNWVNEHAALPYTLKEAALLFEVGSYHALDKIILVSAPKEIRIDRILTRDPQRSKEDIHKIIGQQWTEDKKRSLADFLILNDETELVIPQVLKVHQQILDNSTR